MKGNRDKVSRVISAAKKICLRGGNYLQEERQREGGERARSVELKAMAVDSAKVS